MLGIITSWFAKIKWLRKRVSVMSTVEIGFRLKEQLDLFLMYFEYRFLARQKSELIQYSFCDHRQQVLPSFNWLDVPVSVRKDLLKGHIPLFGVKWLWDRPDHHWSWHCAPENNNRWDAGFFHTIPFRQGNRTGDIRISWEASRLQHLIALALIARSSSNACEKKDAVEIYTRDLISWCDQNPKLTGIHYISAMECALRILSISISFDLIRDELGDKKCDVVRVVSHVIPEHAAFITKRMSLHSSAGNHVLAESVGLIFAGLLFGEHRQANNWLHYGLSVFRTEVARQIDPSGYGLEGASTYLIQIVEYATLCVCLLSHFDIEVPQEILDAYRRGRKCLRELRQLVGTFPVIADSDSGFAVSFLFDEIFNDLSSSSGYLVNSHLYVAGESQQPLSLVFCTGPLGMAPAYGHGHAHALSVQLYADGIPVLVDPGTFSYTGSPEWRSYFRSTKAHNTVTINSSDQANQELLFLWSKPYTCTGHTFESYDGDYIAIAQHNGYSDEGVIHRRVVIFSPNAGLCVKDYLLGTRVCRAELVWNVKNGLEAAGIKLPSGRYLYQDIRSHGAGSGYLDELIVEDGWYSPSYGKMSPLKRLVSVIEGDDEPSFTSIFTLEGVSKSWYENAEQRAAELISSQGN